MKDIHHTGVHGAWCNCDECSPYVPADKHGHERWPTLIVLPLAILVCIGAWALIGSFIVNVVMK